MKAIHSGKAKTNKIDARKIAVPLRGGKLLQAREPGRLSERNSPGNPLDQAANTLDIRVTASVRDLSLPMVKGH
jgi:hypothetical protein